MEMLRVKVNNILCDVIATYHDDETHKDFIIYTDKTFNNKKELNIFYGLYTKKNKNIQVSEITDENDRKIALEIINTIANVKQ